MRKSKIKLLNDTEEIVNKDLKVESKVEVEKDDDDDFISQTIKKYGDTKIRFAKVNWGTGKGPYILAFRNSCDYEYCSCNAHELKPIKDYEIKQNNIHIWEFGSKSPEEINKLPTLDMNEYRKSQKLEKEKKKEIKNE